MHRPEPSLWLVYSNKKHRHAGINQPFHSIPSAIVLPTGIKIHFSITTFLFSIHYKPFQREFYVQRLPGIIPIIHLF